MNKKQLSTESSEEYRSGNDWEMDPKGYFLIKVFYSKGVIGARHYPVHGKPADHEFTGDDSYEIVLHILKAGLVTKKHHAAYLGHELHKAQTALRLGIEYVQDERLDFTKKYTTDPSENVR